MRHVLFAVLVAVPTALITWVLSRGGVPGEPVCAASAPAAMPTPTGDEGKGETPHLEADTRLRTLFAEPLAGAKTTGAVTLYDGDGLFEYINGAAPLFIDRGFRRLAAAELVLEGGGELTCDVYDMGTPKNAAAVYAEERAAQAKPLAVGDEGRLGRLAAAFRQGRYYVKLTAFDSKAEARLPAVAKALSDRVP